MDLNRIAESVLGFCEQEGLVLTDDLTQVEGVVLEVTRRIGAQAIERHLARHRLGYEGARRSCACGGTQRFVEYRSKHVATLLGSVAIRRAYYRCRECGRSALPYDERVGLGAGPESVGLAQAAALLGIQDTFANAAATLYRLTGQRLSESTVQRLTEAVGAVASQEEQQRAAGIEQWRTPAAQAAPQTLYVAVDGVQVHQQDGWHEAKCVTCYWQDAQGKAHSRYAVRFEGASKFVAFVWALACRCGLEQARRVVLLADGADWIWRHIGGLLGEAVCIVDWYHAMQHVWACGRALHGEGTDRTKRWVQEYETLLWEGRVGTMRGRLRAERAQSRSPSRRAALRSLMTYLENQHDRLAYDRFRAMGLDIGSGRVEAACKHVVALRMKRSGMRWSRAGSQQVLSLRTCWLNGDWDTLWKQHPLRPAA